MGSGSSSVYVSDKKDKEDVDEQIDVIALFSALFKLSPVFDVNECLTQSLCNGIMSSKHTCFDDQFVAVEKWVQKYGGDALTMQEIYHLIKYVELYKLNRGRVGKTFSNISAFSDATVEDDGFVPSSAMESEKVEPESLASLMCPFRSDFASWTAEIRAAEADKFFENDDNSTLLLENLDSTQRVGDASMSRIRGYSDMSDLSCE